MTVIVEMETAISIQDVLKNTRKLAGTDVYIERDIIPKKQQMKKVSLLLKKKILAISKKHKIQIREDRMKIKDRWFNWNNDRKLVSGNAEGETELVKLYGEEIKAINLEFEKLLNELPAKN